MTSASRLTRAQHIAAFWLACILFALAARDIARLAHSESNWVRIRTRGTLVVGTDPGVAPYSFLDQSGWAGLDADVAAGLGRQMQLRIGTDPVGYDAMYEALRVGRIDAGMSALSVEPARTRDVAYVGPYFVAGVYALTAPGQAEIAGIAALQGTTVATVYGGDADAFARRAERRVPGLRRIEAGDAREAAQWVRAGRADVAVLHAEDALPLQEEGWGATALSPRPYFIAVEVGNERLAYEIGRALRATKADGALAQITRAWLGQPR